MEIRFENKVAFITGAAGGIGYAAARMFAEAGASVVMADLDSRVTDRAKELEAEQVVLKKIIKANLFSKSFFDTVPSGLEMLNSGNGSPSSKAKPPSGGNSSWMQAVRDNRLIM